MSDGILVKKAQFYYNDYPISRFQKRFEDIYGYGDILLESGSKLITGIISNPSGLNSAVFYQTGRLTGNIVNNESFFTWQNISLTGTGSLGRVFLNYITGYVPASGVIDYDYDYLNKITTSDFININGINFNFVTGQPQNLFEFNNFEHLVNVLNSGSQGAYSNIDNGILRNTVGVSGEFFLRGPREKLTGISANANVGTSVSMRSNNLIFVGAQSLADNNSAGRIYIYNKNNVLAPWSRTIINTPWSPVGGYSKYGTSIAANKDENVFAVGGISNTGTLGSFVGAVAVYTGDVNSNWNVRTFLTGDRIGGYFGASISINDDGRVIAVGEPSFSSTGIIKIFTGNRINGWSFRQSLTGNNVNSRFGTSIAMDKDASIIAVGDTLDGSAFIYTGNQINGWIFKQKITGSHASYGSSLAMSDNGNIIMMGGPFDRPPLNTGAAIIFTGNATAGWAFKQKISGDSSNDQYGTSVAMSQNGNIIAMGGPLDDPNDVISAGGAMVFSGNAIDGWSMLQKISGEFLNDRYGDSLAVNDSGNFILLGAPSSDPNGITNAGTILVYNLNPNKNSIVLTSIARSGEEGNRNKIYRDFEDLNIINIPNRYFAGGITLRPPTTNWTGTFTNTFDVLTVENSGFYSSNLNEFYSLTTQAVAWENNFSGNYIITTGIINPADRSNFSGGRLVFNTGLNKYFGVLVIPSGNSRTIYTGVKFDILKPNPYNVSGNIASYTVSGADFVFSGLIEG